MGSKREDRRTQMREGFSEPLMYDTATWEGMAETAPAKFVDISSFGACILTDRAGEPGGVVKLEPTGWEPGVAMPGFAEIRWTEPAGRRFKMGLQFLTMKKRF